MASNSVEIAVRDPHALLIFSGCASLSFPSTLIRTNSSPPSHRIATSGQTRTHADATEGMSYARLAKLGNLYTQFMTDEERRRRAKNPDDEFERVTTEVCRVLLSLYRVTELGGVRQTLTAMLFFWRMCVT